MPCQGQVSRILLWSVDLGAAVGLPNLATRTCKANVHMHTGMQVHAAEARLSQHYAKAAAEAKAEAARAAHAAHAEASAASRADAARSSAVDVGAVRVPLHNAAALAGRYGHADSATAGSTSSAPWGRSSLGEYSLHACDDDDASAAAPGSAPGWAPGSARSGAFGLPSPHLQLGPMHTGAHEELGSMHTGAHEQLGSMHTGAHLQLGHVHSSPAINGFLHAAADHGAHMGARDAWHEGSPEGGLGSSGSISRADRGGGIGAFGGSWGGGGGLGGSRLAGASGSTVGGASGTGAPFPPTLLSPDRTASAVRASLDAWSAACPDGGAASAPPANEMHELLAVALPGRGRCLHLAVCCCMLLPTCWQ